MVYIAKRIIIPMVSLYIKLRIRLISGKLEANTLLSAQKEPRVSTLQAK